jgi:hypothetical protein
LQRLRCTTSTLGSWTGKRTYLQQTNHDVSFSMKMKFLLQAYPEAQHATHFCQACACCVGVSQLWGKHTLRLFFVNSQQRLGRWAFQSTLINRSCSW